MKKIAVIVPAYNEELLIEKTINSVPQIVSSCITSKRKNIKHICRGSKFKEKWKFER